MGAKIGLKEIFLVVLAQMFLLAKNVGSEESVIHVGVYILYDRGVYDQIRDQHGHEYWAWERKPNDYFSAFLKGVELRFRNMTEKTIIISLVNSSLLNDDKVLKIEVLAPTYYETLNGTETINKLREEALKNAPMYNEGDAVFLVTNRTVLTKEMDNEWFGMAKQGGICDEMDKFGLVTDDGKTFSGVQDMSLQIALLLNASKDEIQNGCNKSEHHLLATIYTGDRSYLSPCSRADIVKFLEKNPKDCLNTPPKTITSSDSVLPNVYHNRTGYDVCASGTTSRWREVKECEPGVIPQQRNYPCRTQCCEYNSRYAIRNGAIFQRWEKLADGATCGIGQMCIQGKCEYTA